MRRNVLSRPCGARCPAPAGLVVPPLRGLRVKERRISRRNIPPGLNNSEKAEKIHMRKAVVTALLILGIAAFGLAQDTKPAEGAPSIDDIVQKSLDACGGKAALEKITSRSYKGTFDLPAMNASGTWERFEKAPNKIYQATEIAGFGTMIEACDGEAAWSQNPMAGFTEKSGASLADAKLDATFNREIKFKELFSKISVLKKDKVGDREAWVVEAVPAQGTPVKFYFDAENWLVLRMDASREGPQGPVNVSTYLEDYKEVDGVKMAHSMRMEFGEFGITMKILEVKSNVEIDDAKFAKPASK
jgi:hypothetical protein